MPGTSVLCLLFYKRAQSYYPYFVFLIPFSEYIVCEFLQCWVWNAPPAESYPVPCPSPKIHYLWPTNFTYLISSVVYVCPMNRTWWNPGPRHGLELDPLWIRKLHAGWICFSVECKGGCCMLKSSGTGKWNIKIMLRILWVNVIIWVSIPRSIRPLYNVYIAYSQYCLPFTFHHFITSGWATDSDLSPFVNSFHCRWAVLYGNIILLLNINLALYCVEQK